MSGSPSIPSKKLALNWASRTVLRLNLCRIHESFPVPSYWISLCFGLGSKIVSLIYWFILSPSVTLGHWAAQPLAFLSSLSPILLWYCSVKGFSSLLQEAESSVAPTVSSPAAVPVSPPDWTWPWLSYFRHSPLWERWRNGRGVMLQSAWINWIELLRCKLYCTELQWLFNAFYFIFQKFT